MQVLIKACIFLFILLLFFWFCSSTSILIPERISSYCSYLLWGISSSVVSVLFVLDITFSFSFMFSSSQSSSSSLFSSFLSEALYIFTVILLSESLSSRELSLFLFHWSGFLLFNHIAIAVVLGAISFSVISVLISKLPSLSGLLLLITFVSLVV